jgi:hypothetical protein
VQFHVEVSNRIEALEDLDAEVKINSAWETIRENIKTSAKESLCCFELKKHKPWLHDPSEINGDNLNNVRREDSRHFRNKKREYLKDNINELATNSKIKNIRDLYTGIKEFERGYQPRNNLVKDENRTACRFPQYFKYVDKLLFSVTECA